MKEARTVLKYQFVLKFRDGTSFAGDTFDASSVPGNGDFLKMMFQKREENGFLTLTTANGESVQRRYDELASVEILLK